MVLGRESDPCGSFLDQNVAQGADARPKGQPRRLQKVDSAYGVVGERDRGHAGVRCGGEGERGK